MQVCVCVCICVCVHLHVSVSVCVCACVYEVCTSLWSWDTSLACCVSGVSASVEYRDTEALRLPSSLYLTCSKQAPHHVNHSSNNNFFLSLEIYTIYVLNRLFFSSTTIIPFSVCY